MCGAEQKCCVREVSQILMFQYAFQNPFCLIGQMLCIVYVVDSMFWKGNSFIRGVSFSLNVGN